MSLIVNIPDEEWVFGLQCQLPPETERWHCLMYESFREIPELNENFKSFWQICPRVPATKEELADITSKHRMMIGDLDAACFLFLLPQYPGTPWAKLKKSAKQNVMSLCPPNDTSSLNTPVDPLYLCISQESLKSKDPQKVRVLLLIDWRVGDAALSSLFVKKIFKVWAAWQVDPIELTSLAQCPHQNGSISELGKNHIGHSWRKHEVCFAPERTATAWKQKFDVWLKKNRPKKHADSREHLVAELKQLAAYRIKKLAAEKGILLSEIICQETRLVPQGMDQLYDDAPDWYRNIKTCETKLKSLRDLVLPLSSRRPIYHGKTEMKNWFTGIVMSASFEN